MYLIINRILFISFQLSSLIEKMNFRVREKLVDIFITKTRYCILRIITDFIPWRSSISCRRQIFVIFIEPIISNNGPV